jgi:hypothetical protein
MDINRKGNKQRVIFQLENFQKSLKIASLVSIALKYILLTSSSSSALF